MRINYALYYCRNNLREEYLKQLYISWVESTLRYGIIHYGGTYPTILEPLVMAQRLAVRTVLFVRKYDRLSHLFSINNIFTFSQLYHYSCINHVYKFINNYELRDFRVNTRASRFFTLKIPNYKKELSRKQFCYIGKELMNNVIQVFGNEILQEKKPKFKMKIKESLSNQDMYSLLTE